MQDQHPVTAAVSLADSASPCVGCRHSQNIGPQSKQHRADSVGDAREISGMVCQQQHVETARRQ